MTEITRIAIDTSKSVFTLHGVDAEGHAVLRRNLRRADMAAFFERLEPLEVAMEACGGTHYWARTLQAIGHRVRLIPAQYVKPFVKRAKNDRNDAEAISEAAARPAMREVAVKSAAAQAGAMLLSVRELLVRQRTQLVNALRGHAAELGLVAPIGAKGLAQLRAAIAAGASLPPAAAEALRLLGAELDRLAARLAEIDAKLLARHRADRTSRRLAEIPGIGPIGALNLACRIDATQFRSGRHFAAWLGLVPRQCSTGGKQRLGGGNPSRSRDGARHQPGRQRTAAPIAGAGRHRGHSPCQTGAAGDIAVAAGVAGAQAAQARGGGAGQQNGPRGVGHADERRSISARRAGGCLNRSSPSQGVRG